MSKYSDRQQARYASDLSREGKVEYVIDCPHPSGQQVIESGVNQWRTTDATQAQRIAASHAGSRIMRKTENYTIPVGKRRPRCKTTWEEVTL